MDKATDQLAEMLEVWAKCLRSPNANADTLDKALTVLNNVRTNGYYERRLDEMRQAEQGED